MALLERKPWKKSSPSKWIYAASRLIKAPAKKL
jgi:hypothetical protein